MAKLSVIVPVYNTYPYLRECLDSIINQTHKNLEIIIVNDASPYEEDDIICKEYAEKDNRIIYIKHIENKGAGGAKQTGIDNATGEYITFVDSDDYLLDKQLYNIILKKFTNNIDIVSFKIKQDSSKNKKSSCKVIYVNENNIIKDEGTILCNKIFKSMQLKKIKFNENIKYDDIPFWFEFCIVNKPVIYKTGFYGYFYRENLNSITKNKNNNYKMIETFNEVLNIANKYNCEKKIHQSIADVINACAYNFYKDIEDKDIKEKYRKEMQIILSNKLLGIKNIGYTLNLFNYIYFIDSEEARDKMIKDIEMYKINKYLYIEPNIMIFKINREIKRIINQIKNLLKKI